MSERVEKWLDEKFSGPIELGSHPGKAVRTDWLDELIGERDQLRAENEKLRAENYARKDANLRTYDGLTERLAAAEAKLGEALGVIENCETACSVLHSMCVAARLAGGAERAGALEKECRQFLAEQKGADGPNP